MTESGVGAPRWLAVPALLGVAFVLLPLLAMLGRVDWPGFGELVTSDSARDALGLSLRTSPLRAESCSELRSVARVSTVALSGEVRVERRVGSAVEDEDVRVIQHAHVAIVGLGEIEKLRPARRPGRTRAWHALVAHRAHVIAR